MPWREKTREDDERELAMLAMRSDGESAPAIAVRFCLAPERVRVLTNRIRDDHAAHTGEDVRGWWNA